MKKTIYHLLGFLFWTFSLTKLLVFDIDIYLVSSLNPDFLPALNFRLVFVLVGVTVLWLILGNQEFLKLFLFVLFYPIILLFWIIPYSLLKKGKWLLIFTYMSGIISTVTNLKKNLIIFVFFGISITLIINSTNEYLIYVAITALSLIAFLILYKKVYFAFTPSSIFAIDTKKIVAYLEENNFGESLLDSKKINEDENLSDNNIITVDKGVFKVPEKLPILILINRSLLFISDKLNRFKESRVYAVFFIIGLLITFSSSIILFSFINFSIYKIDPTAFTLSGSESFFVFLYYSFNSLIMNTISSVEPESYLAITFNMIQYMYGIGLFIILIGIVISISTPRYKEDIDKVIFAFDKQGKRIEEVIKHNFKMTIEQIIAELEKAKHSLIDLIKFIDSKN